jgi:hypothetical protein
MYGFQESEGDRPAIKDSHPIYDPMPLVAIVLALGGWLAGLQRRRLEETPGAVAQASEAPGPEAHSS